MAYLILEYKDQASGAKNCVNTDYLVSVTENPDGAVLHVHDHVTAKDFRVLDTYANIKTALAGADFIEVTAMQGGQKTFINSQYIQSVTNGGSHAILTTNDHLTVRPMPVVETYAAVKTALSIVGV